MSATFAAVTLRPERAGDQPFLFELYASTRQEELDAWGWPPELRASFLQVQFRAQQGFRTLFPEADFEIVELNGQSVGRLIVNHAAEELRLVDIAIMPEARNSGLGTWLIKQILAKGCEAKKPVRLMVQKGCRAERLYQRLGFVKISETEVHNEMEWVAKASTV